MSMSFDATSVGDSAAVADRGVVIDDLGEDSGDSIERL
jgi:hypothetical protein